MRRFKIIIWLPQKQLVSDSKTTFSNQYRLSYALVAMDHIKTFHNKKCLLHKPLVFDLKQTSPKHYRSSKALAVMDNIETFHHKKIITAETVGFRFEADLFKLVPMILLAGAVCHEQH